jgi:hypothetical protein
LKTFFAIGSVLLFLGVALGARFLWYFMQGDRGGHIQSLILAAVFLITGFHTWLIALLADLISVNRRLSEDVLIRLRRIESPPVARPIQKPSTVPADAGAERPAARSARPPRGPRRESPSRGARALTPAAAEEATQWVWLLDETKLEGRAGAAEEKKAAPVVRDEQLAFEDEADPVDAALENDAPAGAGGRRRRRRRGGARQHNELPGNRGKHLAGNDEGTE